MLSGSIISNLLMTEFPTFDIRVEVDAQPDGSDQVVERTVVAVSGELDVATSPALEREVLALLQEGVGEVVVDASGLEFIDASGIGVFVGAANTARERVLSSCCEGRVRRRGACSTCWSRCPCRPRNECSRLTMSDASGLDTGAAPQAIYRPL